MLNRPENLNAAQVAMVQQAVREWIEQTKLRQWCIDKALAAGANDPVDLAAQIEAFVAPRPDAEEYEAK